jgi:hypothetical protein
MKHWVKFNSVWMWLSTCLFPVLKAAYGFLVKGKDAGVRLTMHLKEVLDRSELTDGHLLGSMTDIACSKFLLTRKLQSTFGASGIVWPALRTYIRHMAHNIQLA